MAKKITSLTVHLFDSKHNFLGTNLKAKVNHRILRIVDLDDDEEVCLAMFSSWDWVENTTKKHYLRK